MLVLSFALLVLAMPAPARDITDDAGPLFNPLTRRAVERYIKLMEGDKDQRDSILSLYKGYRDSVQQSISEATKKSEDFKKQQETAGAESRHLSDFKVIEAFVADAEKLETSFLDDFKSLLRPEQAAKFDSVLRSHRRETGIRFSVMAGEGMDLCRIATTAGVDRSNPAIAEAFAEYEVATDRLMLEKRETFQKLFRTVAKSESAGDMPDMEMMNTVMKDIMSQSSRIRDSNRKHARTIGSLLTESQLATWDQEIRKISYPRVYGRSIIAEAVEKSLKSEATSEESRVELRSILENYERDAQPINIRWATMIDEKQASIADKGMAAVMMLGADPDANDSLMKARTARIELDARTLERVKATIGKTAAEALKLETAAIDDNITDDVMSFDEGATSYSDFQKEDDDEAAPE